MVYEYTQMDNRHSQYYLDSCLSEPIATLSIVFNIPTMCLIRRPGTSREESESALLNRGRLDSYNSDIA